MFKKIFYCLLCLTFILTSCSETVKVESKNIGFYYWQTVFKMDNTKKQYLDSLDCKLLYIRLFDIDTQHTSENRIRIAPKSIIQTTDTLPEDFEIVPVVYITRQAMMAMRSTDSMALNIQHIVQSISAQYHWKFDEIQWDFDWTPSTKEAYFDLLKKLKSMPFFSNKKFSCTIRLHQIKHRTQAGIPPVDKGLLMCYNMGNLKKYGDDNSIIDENIAREYLDNMHSYPLKLDVAFPLFSWALLFREKQFISILNDFSLDDIEDISIFEKQENGMCQVKETTFVNGYEVRQGDEIRFETVSKEVLKKVVNYVSQQNNNDTLNILFFSLKQTEINKFPTYELQEIINSY